MSLIDKDTKVAINERIFHLWLACYTQEEIAEREGMTREGVRDVLQDLGDFSKLTENAKVVATHFVDFDSPIYNVATVERRIKYLGDPTRRNNRP